MTAHHHPHDDLLMEYAAGALGEGASLLVATHLALCPRCRAEVARLEAVGGALVEEASAVAVADDALAAVLDRLDDAPAPAARSAPAPFADDEARAKAIPEPLRGYLEGRLASLSWRRVAPGLRQVEVIPKRNGVSTRLLRIAPDIAIPDHGHGGGEHTLVLAGSFSDETGTFARGDVESADPDLEHRPVSGPGEDCICLVVTEAPLRFKGILPRLMQGVLRF